MESGMLRTVLKLTYLAPLVLTGCSESLYLTTLSPEIPDGHVFLAPYFAEVSTKLALSVTGTDTKDLTVKITPITIPKSRAYLYLKPNAFFNDTADIGVSADGFLSSSDTTSQQQVSDIIGNLAKLAAKAGTLPFGPEFAEVRKKRLGPSTRQQCFDELIALSRNGAYYDSFDVSEADGRPIGTRGSNIRLALEIPPVINSAAPTEVGYGKPGFVAFYPVPAVATVICKRDGEPIKLTQPMQLNLPIDSHFLDPKRDFLTNPTDKFTFSGGIITGHKYSAQSPVKTVVDLVAAPVHTLVPSTNVTTKTEVVSVPGKPDQVTRTTDTTTGPEH
jgi:hypothetical protein